MNNKKKTFSLSNNIRIFSYLAKKLIKGSFSHPEGFTLTAHTGCEGTKDNSLDSITVGYVSGADTVEFDLYITDDGSMILSHDEPKGGEVTFEQAIAHIAQFKNLKVNIDVKKAADLSNVLAIAEKYSLAERIFFTGIEREKVETVINTATGVKYYLNTSIDMLKVTDENYIKELADEVIALGACGLNIRYSGCTKTLVDIFHQNGLEVSVWTVNNRFDMKRVFKLGVDNITTRKPREYKKIIASVTGESIDM